jgi:hypothetical protein
MEGRNPVTNALVHLGFRFSLSADIKDFFDTVTPDRVKKILSSEAQKLCFVDGAARQGLPTSPAIANLAAAPMDRAIVRAMARSIGKDGWVYSRYVDDLTVSYDDPDYHQDIRAILEREIHRCGFAANTRKWSLQWAGAGRRVICGVAIDSDGSLHATREARRKLRAARHQDPDSASAIGLEEWCSCKEPSQDLDGKRGYWRTAISLCKRLHIRKPLSIPERVIPEMIDADFRVTHDPAYFLGMSVFTTGWSSCMNPLKTSYNYYRGLPCYLEHRGTAIACLLSDRAISVGGVTRRVMRSRALVHVLREDRDHALAIPGIGVCIINRIYGDLDSNNQLREWLSSKGFITATLADFAGLGGKFVGHINRPKQLPYMDLIKAIHGTAKGGKLDGQEVTCFAI